MTRHADSITEYPGKDDWLGWLDLLCREDTGTIDCVPACMRDAVADDVGPDGRLTDPNLVPPTPFGVAKFLLIGSPLPWSGSGLTPSLIKELLARGCSLDVVKCLADEQRADLSCVDVMIPMERKLAPKLEPEVIRAVASQQLEGFTDLYFIQSGSGPIKIGVSSDPLRRLKGLQTAHPFKLELLCVVEGAGRREPEYHARFAEHRLFGEWFSPAPEILAEIQRLQTGEGEQV